MSIKEIFNCLGYLDITSKYISSVKIKKSNFSNSDKKFLLTIIGNFKKQDIEETLKAIKMYAIWEPDEAIEEARKKGVFRYKAYGFSKNQSLNLLKNLTENRSVFKFSQNTNKYLVDKERLCWLYDFYKSSEKKIVEYIKKHHDKRVKVRKGNQIFENALFKGLLAYIDISFYINRRSKNTGYLNKNKFSGYSIEDICDGISYIVFLYDSVIGLKQDKHYFINHEFVLSDKIESLILIACKVIELQEWELSIDYFDYKIEVSSNEWIIFDKNEIFEKSIRMGFVRRQIQEQVHYTSSKERLKDSISLEQVGDFIESEMGDMITKEVSDGKLSRYRFEFPEALFMQLGDEKKFGKAWFSEEISSIEHCSRELIMSYEELAQKKITANSVLLDIVLFQRFFLLLNEISSKILFKKKDFNKVVASLIPSFSKEELLCLLNIFVKDKVKSQELLDLFTYKKDVKLDLQYTPFLQVSGRIIVSNTIVTKSNLLRNVIAYSYLSKNKIANDIQGLEPLVQKCSDIFKSCKERYNVLTNRKYKYMGKEGEVDVIVVSDTDIILIECKCPHSPINNFEMRSNLDHIEKANKQLDLSKKAFEDKHFKRIYLKAWGIEDKNQNILTCIVFGNRLFSGCNMYSHPIRYIYELDMVLNSGMLYSEIGDWSVWKNKTFSHSDLLDFLSEDKTFIRYNLASMEESKKTMFVKGKKVTFKTYAYNVAKSIHLYDSNLKIIKSNDILKKELARQTTK